MKKEYAIWIVIFLIGFATGVHVCSPPDQSGIRRDTTTVVHTEYDTIPVYDTTFVPVQGSTIDLVNERDTLIFDTLQVFTALNRIRTYQRTFTDPWAEIRATAEVHGYLMDLQIEYANLKPGILETKTIERTIRERYPQRGLFIGAHAGIPGPSGEIPVYASAGLLTRKGWYFQYQYDPFNRIHVAGISRKIL